MNVMFWSYQPGMSGVSGSMLAVSLTTAIKYKINCSICQLHYRNNGLIDSVIKDNMDELDFSNTGIDALLRGASAGSLSEEDVANSAFSFLSGKFNVFTATSLHDEHIYVNNLIGSAKTMFETMEKAFKINFIDVPAGMNNISKAVLNYADVIAVCLPQSNRVISRFFDQIKIPKEKLFIVMGDYDDKQFMSLSNVMWKNSDKVNMMSGGVVPHCAGFADAMNQSRSIYFFAHGQDLKASDANYEFIKSVNVVTSRLLKKCKLTKG